MTDVRSAASSSSAPNQPLAARSASNRNRKLTFWPLVAATYFMVSGGTYGTEGIVAGAGYGWAIVILLVTPIVWSLPTAYMIGELSSALPEVGGFYAWVCRGLGRFWGFQEAWLSLAASVFDMAIYPTLFVAYLARLFPWVGQSYHGLMVGLAMVIFCALWNIAGAKAVAEGAFWMFLLLLAPFAVITCFALVRHNDLGGAMNLAPAGNADIVGGVLVAMWNYMGWDNASTVAAEVENPQRNYPRAMMVTMVLVALSYVIPIGAMWHTHIAPALWGQGGDTGAWADLAAMVAGPWLRVAVVAGGVVSSFGMFNALVMSYTRLPLAMARDRMLPAFFGKLMPKSGAPWVSILVLAAGWAVCLTLDFKRLVTMDILLYGLSLLLEFAALVALRIREPQLERPFKVPGGVVGTAAIGVLPALLLGFAGYRSYGEKIGDFDALAFGCVLVAAGFGLYFVSQAFSGAQTPDEILAESAPIEVNAEPETAE